MEGQIDMWTDVEDVRVVIYGRSLYIVLLRIVEEDVKLDFNRLESSVCTNIQP